MSSLEILVWTGLNSRRLIDKMLMYNMNVFIITPETTNDYRCDFQVQVGQYPGFSLEFRFHNCFTGMDSLGTTDEGSYS
jgi:hypothetical protein